MTDDNDSENPHDDETAQPAAANAMDLVLARHAIIHVLEKIGEHEERTHAAVDPGLAEVLAAHTRDEKVHLARVLAWMRTADPELDEAMAEHQPVTEEPAAAPAPAPLPLDLPPTPAAAAPRNTPMSMLKVPANTRIRG